MYSMYSPRLQLRLDRPRCLRWSRCELRAAQNAHARGPGGCHVRHGRRGLRDHCHDAGPHAHVHHDHRCAHCAPLEPALSAQQPKAQRAARLQAPLWQRARWLRFGLRCRFRARGDGRDGRASGGCHRLHSLPARLPLSAPHWHRVGQRRALPVPGANCRTQPQQHPCLRHRPAPRGAGLSGVDLRGDLGPRAPDALHGVGVPRP